MQMVNNMTPQTRHYLLRGCISLLLIILVMSPFSQFIKGAVNQDSLVSQNEAYLASIEKSDRTNLIMLAELSSFLSVMNSSEVGVSFFVNARVQVGNALSKLTEMTDKAFEVTLASLAITSGLRWLLKICDFSGYYIFVGLLILISLYCFLSCIPVKKALYQSVTKLIEFVFLIFISVYLLVPYCVHGAYLLDGIIYSEMGAAKNTNMKNMHDAIVKDGMDSSFLTHAEDDIKRFEDVVVKLPQKVEGAVSYYIEHLVYTIFRGIVIPFGVFLILFLFSRWILVPLFRELIYWPDNPPMK